MLAPQAALGVRTPTVRTEISLMRRLSSSGLAWGFVTSAALALWILYGMRGAEYYATDLSVRAYDTSHRLLRPSGPAGQSFGLVGTLLMLVPFLYVARKRIPGLRNVGSIKHWLEVHLFCGIVGPVLVTFHTTFKFNGLISAAYWSMAIVVLSGFAGRHLYLRIPRSIKGNELTRADLDTRSAELQQQLEETAATVDVRRIVGQFQAELEHLATGSWFRMLFGEFLIGRRLRSLDKALAQTHLPLALRAGLVRLTAERILVRARAENLQRTRQLFQLWHVFHLPLVYLLLVIATLHIGLALYMGYVPFRW